jgi:group I intron endonuclease
MIVIYEFVNKINGKVYVGQAKDFKSRLRCHKYHTKSNKKNSPFYAALRKYGWDSFFINIIEVCDIEILNDREEYWISEKKCLHPNGYNLMKGGKQYEMSDETKKKISEVRKGIKFCPKHIENLRKSHLGNKLSEETKRKLSEINKGRIHSEETRLKLRYSNPNRKEIGRFDKEGILVSKYESIKEAARILECNVGHLSECCRGKRKLAKILNSDTLRYLTTEDI